MHLHDMLRTSGHYGPPAPAGTQRGTVRGGYATVAAHGGRVIVLHTTMLVWPAGESQQPAIGDGRRQVRD